MILTLRTTDYGVRRLRSGYYLKSYVQNTHNQKDLTTRFATRFDITLHRHLFDKFWQVVTLPRQICVTIPINMRMHFDHKRECFDHLSNRIGYCRSRLAFIFKAISQMCRGSCNLSNVRCINVDVKFCPLNVSIPFAFNLPARGEKTQHACCQRHV